MTKIGCGACGADMLRRSECKVCKNPRVLAALGIQRRRWRAIPWLVALLFMSAALAGLPSEDQHIVLPPAGDDAGPGYVQVTARPGQAARVNFDESDSAETPNVAMPLGSAQPEPNVNWGELLAPLGVWLLIAVRLALIALGPRNVVPPNVGTAEAGAPG